jgi:hypothetical protein
MAAEYIDDTLNGSGQYPTKIPGYEDAADIQEALRLYHYGTTIIPATSIDINDKSIAGYLKALQTSIDNSADAQTAWAGVGLDWNSVSEQFDIDSTVATKSYVGHSTSTITKVSGFTLELADASKTILLNASSPMTLVIPSNVSVAIPVGYQYNFIEIGSARTTFSPASGVTVGSKNSQLFLDGTYSKGTLVKIATDTWILYGDVYEGVAVVTTTTAAPPFFPYFVPATTTAAPPFFPYFVPATGTTGATPAPTTTTTTTVAPNTGSTPTTGTTGATPAPTTGTTGATPAPTTTTTAAPTPSFTTLPYETNVTHNSFTINWVGANVGSWKVMSAGTGVVYGSGDGAGGSITRTGLASTTSYTQTVYLYSGAGQTGSSVSDPITVSTNMDPTTSYWSTGCCSTTGTQVTGDSTVNNTYSTNDMNSRCAGTVTNVQTGQNSAVPVVSCSTTTTTTTTVAPNTGSTPTTGSTSTTTTTTVAPGTTYYACCTNGLGVQGSYLSAQSAVTNLTTQCQSDEPGNTIQGGVSTTPTGCNPATTTTTAAPATTTTAAPNTGTTVTTTTTTAAPATTTTTAAPLCSDPSILNQSQCSSCGYYWSINYGECSSTPWTTTTAAPTTTTAAPVTTGATTTTTAAPATTTTAAPVTTGATTTTTAAPATTTTAAPAGGTTCTSFDVSVGCCSTTGCDSGGCGTGSACSPAANNRCYQGGINC